MYGFLKDIVHTYCTGLYVVNKKCDLQTCCSEIERFVTCTWILQGDRKFKTFFWCHEKNVLWILEKLLNLFFIETSSWMTWWHIYVRKWQNSERPLSKLLCMYCMTVWGVWIYSQSSIISTSCSIPPQVHVV